MEGIVRHARQVQQEINAGESTWEGDFKDLHRGATWLVESFTAASSNVRSTGPRANTSGINRKALGVDPVEAIPALMKSKRVRGKRPSDDRRPGRSSPSSA